MNHDRKKQDKKHRYISIALIVFLFIFIALTFVGCKSLSALPSTNTHESSRDSIHTELRVDTIYQDRWHKEYMKGDTFYIHDSIDRWRIHEVYIHDSIDNSRIDTIYQPVQVEKAYKRFLVNSGIALWVLIGLAVAAAIVGIVLKFAR